MHMFARCRAAVAPSLIILVLALGMVGVTPNRNASAAPRAGVSPEEKATLLANHNEWRTRYNSPALVWDDNLAAFADAWGHAAGQHGRLRASP
jgi:uncharacterized protein YkwD